MSRGADLTYALDKGASEANDNKDLDKDIIYIWLITSTTELSRLQMWLLKLQQAQMN